MTLCIVLALLLIAALVIAWREVVAARLLRMELADAVAARDEAATKARYLTDALTRNRDAREEMSQKISWQQKGLNLLRRDYPEIATAYFTTAGRTAIKQSNRSAKE